MKKFLFGSVLAACACLFAALDVSTTKCIPVIAPASVSSGATNSSVVAVNGLKGIGGVTVQANASAGRSLDVTLWQTNTVAGGWTVVAHETFANTNACVARIFFSGEYLAPFVKVGVGSIGGSSVVSAFIESH